MTARGDAPPQGATSPTDGATSTVWSQTARFNELLQTLIRLQLEEQLRNPLPFLLPGNYVPASMVKGSNGTMRFLAVGDLAVDVSDTSDLWVKIEGEPNDAEDLDFGYEEFSVKQGMFTVRITDVAALESPIDLMSVAAAKVARRALEIGNAIIAKAVIAGTHTLYVGTDGSPTNAEVLPTDVLTGAAVRDAVAELEVGNVPTFADTSYRGFLHPYVKVDLSSDTAAGGWTDVNKYTNADTILNNEIGKYAGVRFIKSIVGGKVANAGASSNDVFITPILGPGAVALGDFGAAQTYFTPPGGHSDPGHQSSLVTWIGYLGAFLIGEGDNASGPVSGPRYINIFSGSSKSTS